jgi:RNA polymerase sigma factor (sigma-70 family)
MVWNVCRRLLRRHHDAEDAFQATFLILVKKAATIRDNEMVGNWLYGVAHQTGVRMRAIAAKRNARERQVTEMPEPEVLQQDLWNDLKLILDQELSHLPEKHRFLIVLCHLEGRSIKDVARQIGCPEGTAASRLARARTMLAKRLARRGVTFSGGILGAMLSAQAVSASVPSTVMCSTMRAATLLVAGQAAAGTISPTVASLIAGVTKAMIPSKLKTVTAFLLMTGMVTLMSTMLALGQTEDKGNYVEKPAVEGEKQAAQAQNQKDSPKTVTNSIGMKFVWIKPGSFMMGSPKEEKDRRDEETQHKVTLSQGFYMGIHLVTQDQWQEVMGKKPSEFKGEKNLPVEQVSWEDCQAFIKNLREKDKKLYRLPTEAEWEYCCRAGTKTPFHFGETISTDQANYHGNFTYGDGTKGVYRKGG